MTSPSDEAVDISAQIIRCIQQQLSALLHEQLMVSDGLVRPTLHIEGVIHEGCEGAVSRRINLVRCPANLC